MLSQQISEIVRLWKVNEIKELFLVYVSAFV